MKTLPLLLLTALVASAQLDITESVRTNHPVTVRDITLAMLTNSAPTNIVALLRDSGTLSNVVHELRVTGEVCKSVGRHSFRDGRPGEGEGGNGAWYADGAPMYTDFRTCRVCGRQETRSKQWSGPPDVLAVPQIPWWTNQALHFVPGSTNIIILTNGNIISITNIIKP